MAVNKERTIELLEKLTPTDFTIYMCLWAHARGGIVHDILQKDIAKVCGCSTRSVGRALIRLRNQKLVKTEQPYRPAGTGQGREAMVYVLQDS